MQPTSVDITDYYAVRVGRIWAGLKREPAAFWWICIYTFFEYVRPQNLYPVLDILPWAQISLIVACVTAFQNRDIKWVKNPANSLIVIFFMVVLLSVAFAFNLSTSLEKIDVIVGWVLVYFLMITIINNEKRFIVFLLLFFLVNFKMSQFGFRDFITRGYSKFGVAGSPGWFRDSGDLGIQMTIFVSLSSAFILALRSQWEKYKRLLLYMLPVTGLVTIIATSSRGAQLGMAAAGIWFLLINRRIKVIVGLFIVGYIFYTLLPPEMLAEYGSAGEDRTSIARLTLWDYGLKVIEQHPVLGVGYFNWVEYCWFMLPGGFENGVRCMATHNTYVQGAVETGIVGLFIYLLLIALVFITNARTRANARQVGNRFILYMTHGLDGGLISYLVSSYFFSVYFYPMFWMQLAMAVALNEISKRQLPAYMNENSNTTVKGDQA